MSTQNAEKADSVRPEDKEKDVLNRFTELCIRKKDRGKEFRDRIERRIMPDRYPEISRSDVLIEDEKTMEEMLQLYLEISNELSKFKKVGSVKVDNVSVDTYCKYECNCLDHILPTCEHHNEKRINRVKTNK
jgi:hypothetical protein